MDFPFSLISSLIFFFLISCACWNLSSWEVVFLWQFYRVEADHFPHALESGGRWASPAPHNCFLTITSSFYARNQVHLKLTWSIFYSHRHQPPTLHLFKATEDLGMCWQSFSLIFYHSGLKTLTISGPFGLWWPPPHICDHILKPVITKNYPPPPRSHISWSQPHILLVLSIRYSHCIRSPVSL